jgi:hypothetical protein
MINFKIAPLLPTPFNKRDFSHLEITKCTHCNCNYHICNVITNLNPGFRGTPHGELTKINWERQRMYLKNHISYPVILSLIWKRNLNLIYWISYKSLIDKYKRIASSA